MDAVKDFAVALSEVDALLAISEKGDPKSADRPVLIKASLLLLATKVECFFEALVEEYCELACTKESAAHLPPALRVSASRKLFAEGKLDIEHPDINQAIIRFTAIAELWSDKHPCPQVTVDSKFSYGKHGEQQVIKLFRRIGIDDVFQRFLVDDETESLASPEGPTSIAPDFNSMSSIRNNITHSDATPALTEADIRRQKRRLLLFASKLEQHLETSLGNPIESGAYHI
jgi:hypothetical protein